MLAASASEIALLMSGVGSSRPAQITWALASWEEPHWKEVWYMNYQCFRVGTWESSRTAQGNEHSQEGYSKGNVFKHCTLHRM